MADPASIRAFVLDLQRDVRAYKAHLVPRRQSLLREVIPAATGAITSVLATPAAGAAARQVAGALVATGKFRPYMSPFGSAFRRGRAASALEIRTLRRELEVLVPQGGGARAAAFRSRLRATAGDALGAVRFK